ncbi:hypothetical protein OTU49_001020, partial [Cherax quadricarinatus]
AKVCLLYKYTNCLLLFSLSCKAYSCILVNVRTHFSFVTMTHTCPLRILELYSGIGGMRVSATESGLPFKIVGSYEINTTALEVYRENFPEMTKPHNIMGLNVDELRKLNPDIIMMSPPCQPFTRA